MIKLLLAALLLASIGYLLYTFYKKLDLINKQHDLERVDIEGDILDIDRDIAAERQRQRNVKKEIDELNN